MLAGCVLIVSAMIVVVSTCRSQFSAEITRVHNGYNAPKGAYPFVVALLNFNDMKIGTGSLISENWVLTVAHSTHYVNIQYGDMTAPQEMMAKSKILAIKALSNYEPPDPFNPTMVCTDLALLKIEKVLHYIYNHKFAVLSTVNYTTLVGSRVLYAGFGVKAWTVDPVVDPHMPLQIAEGNMSLCDGILPVSYCICILPDDKKLHHATYGDSGAPVILGGTVIGVVKGAIEEEYRWVTTATPVAPFLTWMSSVMSGTDKRPKLHSGN